jgi:hypothetical protein
MRGTFPLVAAITAVLAGAACVRSAHAVMPANTGADIVTAEALRPLVEARVTERLGESGSTATVVSVAGLRDQRVPPGERRIDIGAITGPLPRARVPVAVTIHVGGARVTTQTAWVSLRDLRRVVVYTAPADARTASHELQVGEGVVDLVCCPGARPVDPRVLTRQRLRRGARAGAPALDVDFEPLPAVTRNAPVTIRVARGTVHLVARGTALADGHVGQRVAVHADGANAPVIARVSGNHEVTLDE